MEVEFKTFNFGFYFPAYEIPKMSNYKCRIVFTNLTAQQFLSYTLVKYKRGKRGKFRVRMIYRETDRDRCMYKGK